MPDRTEADPTSASWPPPEGVPLGEALVQAWRESVFAPRRFFPQLGRRDTILPDLLYYLALGIAVAGIGLFWRMVLPATGAGGLLDALLGRTTASASPLLDFLLSPLWLLLSLFLSAGVVHLLLLILGGAEGGIATTVRVFCFAYGPQLFAVVPVLGALMGGIWTVVLAIVGLRVAHGTSTGRAAAAVLLPLFLLVLVGTLAGLLLLARGVEL